MTSRRTAGSTTAVRTRASGSRTTTTTRTTGGKTQQKQRINLAGSTAVVSDYFHYAINAILYQRAIYDQADFKIVKKFGLQMMLIEDQSIADYLSKIVDQVRLWLLDGKISRLVLVILRKDTGETIERWEFDVHVEGEEADSAAAAGPDGPPEETAAATTEEPKGGGSGRKGKKTLAQVQSEIQTIIRQIIATVSFLPIPDAPRTFKILAHTHAVGRDDAAEWNDSDAFEISHAAERVKLKSFSTALHRVDTAVDYKLAESDV